jgi:hypothetical protein
MFKMVHSIQDRYYHCRTNDRLGSTSGPASSHRCLHWLADSIQTCPSRTGRTSTPTDKMRHHPCRAPGCRRPWGWSSWQQPPVPRRGVLLRSQEELECAGAWHRLGRPIRRHMSTAPRHHRPHQIPGRMCLRRLCCSLRLSALTSEA